LLFDISEILFPGDASKAQTNYVLFEVAQFDTYAYLFDKPHYITLDGSAPPSNAQMRGMRVAMNGQEVEKGQTYATVDMSLAVGTEELGQPLSVLGAVLPLEKGPDSDEFFLTFDELGPASYTRAPNPSLFVDGRDQVVNAADLPEASHVGLRTFDEINATYAAVTGVDPTTPAVATTYAELRQSLPAVEDVNTFLSSHQVAVAQLAIEYCNALIDGPGAATYFPNFNFNDPKSTAFSVANRSNFVDPLVKNIVGHLATDPQIGTQPTYNEVYSELASFGGAGDRPPNLIDRLVAGASNTRAISKGVCAAALGSAVTLVQ
ncbi:MAG: hypothetical protein R3358_13965, partial [Woeseiaceae bacterium]|nr:hypothetical protein [Woeseiaceae bacterium]